MQSQKAEQERKLAREEESLSQVCMSHVSFITIINASLYFQDILCLGPRCIRI
jgi:hypothetical protein